MTSTPASSAFDFSESNTNVLVQNRSNKGTLAKLSAKAVEESASELGDNESRETTEATLETNVDNENKNVNLNNPALKTTTKILTEDDGRDERDNRNYHASNSSNAIKNLLSKYEGLKDKPEFPPHQLPVLDPVNLSSFENRDSNSFYDIMWDGADEPLFQEQVSAQYNSKLYGFLLEDLDSISLPIRKYCDQIWDRKLRITPTLFNGSKFRLASTFMDDYDGSGAPKLVLKAGLTSYRAFICTNANVDAIDSTISNNNTVSEVSSRKEHINLRNMLKSLGKEQNNERAFISDCLGVNAVVTTSDNYMILIKRSKNTGEFHGYVDCPEHKQTLLKKGGHPEPKNAARAGNTGAEITGESFVAEFFDSIIQEIIEEINIPRAFLSKPVLLGIARQKPSNGRPVASFRIRCSLSAGNVRQLYDQNNCDESVKLLLVPSMCIYSKSFSSLGEKEAKELRNITPGCAFAFDQWKKSHVKSFSYYPN